MGDSSRVGSSSVGGVYTNPLYNAEAAKPKGALRDGTTVEQGPAQNPPTRNTAAGNAFTSFLKTAWQEVKSFLSGLFTRPAAPEAAPVTTPATAPAPAPLPDPSLPASAADCDAIYDTVKQDLGKLNDLPQFMRNQVLTGLNAARAFANVAAAEYAAGMSTDQGSVKAYDNALAKEQLRAQQAGETFTPVPAEARTAVVRQAAANIEGYLTEMIGGVDEDAIQAKADAVPQALCDLVATALRALDDHLEAQGLGGTDLARDAKETLTGKLLGNRMIGPACGEAKMTLFREAIAIAERELPPGAKKTDAKLAPEAEAIQDNVSQINNLLPQFYSKNDIGSTDAKAINGQLTHPVSDWRTAFASFAEKVAERGADAADAASQRGV